MSVVTIQSITLIVKHTHTMPETIGALITIGTSVCNVHPIERGVVRHFRLCTVIDILHSGVDLHSNTRRGVDVHEVQGSIALTITHISTSCTRSATWFQFWPAFSDTNNCRMMKSHDILLINHVIQYTPFPYCSVRSCDVGLGCSNTALPQDQNH